VAGERGVVLVTGGNRGIGFEACRQLAQAGFEVILTARDIGVSAAAALLLQREGLSVTAHPLDVTRPASIDTARDWVQRERGVLDVLVNNAGIYPEKSEDVVTADFRLVEETWQTNTLGPWRLTQALVPLLRLSDHPRVVNVSSGLGAWSSMTGRSPAYNLSKLALNGLTVMLANRLRSERILVNAIDPGWVATDMGAGGGRPVQDGAAGVAWAALLPDDGPTGGFYHDGRNIDF
jgi:NAD(P)-dependent dehydrogenase (short-subunit alcohol dehydrogenase family)